MQQTDGFLEIYWGDVLQRVINNLQKTGKTVLVVMQAEVGRTEQEVKNANG